MSETVKYQALGRMDSNPGQEILKDVTASSHEIYQGTIDSLIDENMPHMEAQALKEVLDKARRTYIEEGFIAGYKSAREQFLGEQDD